MLPCRSKLRTLAKIANKVLERVDHDIHSSLRLRYEEHEWGFLLLREYSDYER